MGTLERFKNRLIAKVITRWPSLAKGLIENYKARSTEDAIPWATLSKPLSKCTVALVTTGGVHLKGQPIFDMHDPDGDPSFRIIEKGVPMDQLMITHDYYDHADADRDLNIVMPIQRLREFVSAGVLGAEAPFHLGFMGHITGPHLETLIARTAPEAARMLRKAGVDVLLGSPG